MENRNKDKCRAWVGFSVNMAHRITAGTRPGGGVGGRNAGAALCGCPQSDESRTAWCVYLPAVAPVTFAVLWHAQRPMQVRLLPPPAVRPPWPSPA